MPRPTPPSTDPHQFQYDQKETFEMIFTVFDHYLSETSMVSAMIPQ